MLLAGSLLTGCGGGQPLLARADVAPLIALSNRIAREGSCAQARDIRTLQAQAIRLVNTRRVPGRLQEPFLGGVNVLASRVPACVPSVPAETPPAATGGGSTDTPSPGRTHGEEGNSHGKGHGHGYGDGTE